MFGTLRARPVASRSEQPDCRHTFLEWFRKSQQGLPPPAFNEVDDAYGDAGMYYETMRRNVLAEAVSSFCSSGPRVQLDAKQTLKGVAVTRVQLESQNGSDPSQSGADLQLKDNVVGVDGELFWVTKCEVSSVQILGGTKHMAELEGFSSSGSQLHEVHFPYGQEKQLRVHIFAGDYLNRYRCAHELLLGMGLTDPELERAVLNPRCRGVGTYRPAGQIREDLMPINSDQRSAVYGLSSRLEIVHGPPGTGKSTTIFHMLSSRLPSTPCAAIVTCVTNQAIDAVVEKLGQTHDCPGGLRILVLGNPDRVGRTAGQYTLDNLCKRDELVLSMTWAANLLSRTLKAVVTLQSTRMERLWRPHRRSRLQLPQIECLPSVIRYRLDLEAGNWERRRRGEAPVPYDPVDFYLRRIDGIKKKLAQAAIQLRPARFLRRRRFGMPRLPRVEWHVHPFQLRLEKALERARAALSLATSTAAARNVRKTRVLLCTIPSSYKAPRPRPSQRIAIAHKHPLQDERCAIAAT